MNIDTIILRAKHAAKTNWLAAVNILRDGIAEYPVVMPLQRELAALYYQKKAYKETLEIYHEILKSGFESDITCFNIANIYMEMREPKLAVYYYEKIGDTIPDALFNKALALEKLHQNDAAIESLKKLISYKNVINLTYFILIELLINEGHETEAEEYLIAAERKYGKSHQTHYLRAIIYSARNNWLVVYHELALARPGYTQNPKMLHMFGLAADHIGYSEQAIKLLRDAIYLKQGNKPIYLDFISLLYRQGYISDTSDFINISSLNAQTVCEMTERICKSLDLRA
jgi:tetratricopeptide (TPR) repeat protein